MNPVTFAAFFRFPHRHNKFVNTSKGIESIYVLRIKSWEENTV